MDSLLFWLQLFDASFRLATPLLFAALGGLLCERSGIIDIGLEGKMLFSAFAGAAWVSISGSPWQGMMVAILAGMACSCCMHLFASPIRAIR